MQSKKNKIAIVAYNLEVGGLSKVITTLYKLLATVKNLEVELLLLDNKKDISFIDNFTNFNERSSSSFTFLGKIRKYIRFKKYLKQSKFDFIIDQRYRVNFITEILIVKFLYPKTNVIYNIHSSRIQTYLPESKWITKHLYSNAYKIVCCSKGVEQLVNAKHNLRNTFSIYNPLELSHSVNWDFLDFDFEYILAVGRVEPLKQFDKLIEAYSKSNLPNKNIKLVVVGDGSQLEYCKELAKTINIRHHVVFIGSVLNPYHYMKKALFLVLCSMYEGFPMVLIETLSVGTPVVSFDLLTGPNEIIIPNVNGILVQNQNFIALIKAINMMEEDKKFYEMCKEGANKSIMKFSDNVIKKDWLHLLGVDY